MCQVPYWARLSSSSKLLVQVKLTREAEPLGVAWERGFFRISPGLACTSSREHCELSSQFQWLNVGSLKSGSIYPAEISDVYKSGSSRCITELWKELGKQRSGRRSWRMRGVTYWKHWWIRQLLLRNPEVRSCGRWIVQGKLSVRTMEDVASMWQLQLWICRRGSGNGLLLLRTASLWGEGNKFDMEQREVRTRWDPPGPAGSPSLKEIFSPTLPFLSASHAPLRFWASSFLANLNLESYRKQVSGKHSSQVNQSEGHNSIAS